jgi:hypothetical protein
MLELQHFNCGSRSQINTYYSYNSATIQYQIAINQIIIQTKDRNENSDAGIWNSSGGNQNVSIGKRVSETCG